MDAVVGMTEKVTARQRASAVGLALIMGAGVGLIIGLLVWDGAGIAMGVALGAALGVVVGAVWDGMRPKG